MSTTEKAQRADLAKRIREAHLNAAGTNHLLGAIEGIVDSSWGAFPFALSERLTEAVERAAKFSAANPDARAA